MNWIRKPYVCVHVVTLWQLEGTFCIIRVIFIERNICMYDWTLQTLYVHAKARYVQVKIDRIISSHTTSFLHILQQIWTFSILSIYNLEKKQNLIHKMLMNVKLFDYYEYFWLSVWFVVCGGREPLNYTIS